jgi:hypothetical protein
MFARRQLKMLVRTRTVRRRCFRASSDAGVVLLCCGSVVLILDPLNRVHDWGLPLNQRHVVLEIPCATDCRWDWTYWAVFEPESRH